jgi:hypothetical protein
MACEQEELLFKFHLFDHLRFDKVGDFVVRTLGTLQRVVDRYESYLPVQVNGYNHNGHPLLNEARLLSLPSSYSFLYRDIVLYS